MVFVPLEAIQPPRPMVSVLASRLGLRERPGTSWRESALAALRGRPRLLLLDGAEHYREEVAGLAGEFLASAPNLCIVVTSRVVLGVPGEVCWATPPLDCPSVAAGAREIAASDAVQLFIARASDRLPGFSVADVPPHAIGELCRRLGGLPLAIELIAGWVGTLSVREILQQRVALLEYDPPGAPGSRKLADVLRASYDLLQSGQQRTLRLLSVFNTPFSLADVQAVTGVSEQEVAGVVRGLVDASWLVVTRGLEQNRFSMVETIREFATARLREAGEAAEARRRHAMHFADLAIQSSSSLAGPDARRWAARLASAVDDLRAMMQWAHENGEIDLGLEVGAALWRWWLTSGRLSAGRAWLDKFLTAAGEHPVRTAEESQRIGRAVCAAAVLAVENGDYAEAVRLATQAMRILEPLEPGEDLAFAATVLGSAQRYLGDRAEARRSFQTALDLRAAARRPRETGHGDEQHGADRDRRRESRPGQGAARAEPHHQAPARRAALDRDRPAQPGRRADQGRPVAGGAHIARRGRGTGRRPAPDHGPRPVQPGPPRGQGSGTGSRRPSSTPTPSPPAESAAIPTT